MEIIYEDNHVIIVAKRSGEIVQGDKTGDEPLSETVKAYIKEKYQKPGAVFLGVVHRLDRPVSGLVVFARTSKALTRLNEMFRKGEVHKTYWALVEEPTQRSGDGSDDPISKGNGITQNRPHDQYPVKIGENEHIVLNTADTTELRRVPGIGPYYAKEIVRHGKWLGGYVSVNQLDEIENFPQEAKKYFVIQHASPKKLNVNKLSLQELRKHPYINYYMAKTIVDYRRLHGPIKSLEDLRLSKDFPPEVIKRLTPYVEY